MAAAADGGAIPRHLTRKVTLGAVNLTGVRKSPAASVAVSSLQEGLSSSDSAASNESPMPISQFKPMKSIAEPGPCKIGPIESSPRVYPGDERSPLASFSIEKRSNVSTEFSKNMLSSFGAGTTIAPDLGKSMPVMVIAEEASPGGEFGGGHDHEEAAGPLVSHTPEEFDLGAQAKNDEPGTFHQQAHDGHSQRDDYDGREQGHGQVHIQARSTSCEDIPFTGDGIQHHDEHSGGHGHGHGHRSDLIQPAGLLIHGDNYGHKHVRGFVAPSASLMHGGSPHSKATLPHGGEQYHDHDSAVGATHERTISSLQETLASGSLSQKQGPHSMSGTSSQRHQYQLRHASTTIDPSIPGSPSADPSIPGSPSLDPSIPGSPSQHHRHLDHASATLDPFIPASPSQHHSHLHHASTTLDSSIPGSPSQHHHHHHANTMQAVSLSQQQSHPHTHHNHHHHHRASTTLTTASPMEQGISAPLSPSQRHPDIHHASTNLDPIIPGSPSQHHHHLHRASTTLDPSIPGSPSQHQHHHLHHASTTLDPSIPGSPLQHHLAHRANSMPAVSLSQQQSHPHSHHSHHHHHTSPPLSSSLRDAHHAHRSSTMQGLSTSASLSQQLSHQHQSHHNNNSHHHHHTSPFFQETKPAASPSQHHHIHGSVSMQEMPASGSLSDQHGHQSHRRHHRLHTVAGTVSHHAHDEHASEHWAEHIDGDVLFGLLDRMCTHNPRPAAALVLRAWSRLRRPPQNPRIDMEELTLELAMLKSRHWYLQEAFKEVYATVVKMRRAGKEPQRQHSEEAQHGTAEALSALRGTRRHALGRNTTKDIEAEHGPGRETAEVLMALRVEQDRAREHEAKAGEMVAALRSEQDRSREQEALRRTEVENLQTEVSGLKQQLADEAAESRDAVREAARETMSRDETRSTELAAQAASFEQALQEIKAQLAARDEEVERQAKRVLADEAVADAMHKELCGLREVIESVDVAIESVAMPDGSIDTRRLVLELTRPLLPRLDDDGNPRIAVAQLEALIAPGTSKSFSPPGPVVVPLVVAPTAKPVILPASVDIHPGGSRTPPLPARRQLLAPARDRASSQPRDVSPVVVFPKRGGASVAQPAQSAHLRGPSPMRAQSPSRGPSPSRAPSPSRTPPSITGGWPIPFGVPAPPNSFPSMTGQAPKFGSFGLQPPQALRVPGLTGPVLPPTSLGAQSKAFHPAGPPSSVGMPVSVSTLPPPFSHGQGSVGRHNAMSQAFSSSVGRPPDGMESRADVASGDLANGTMRIVGGHAGRLDRDARLPMSGSLAGQIADAPTPLPPPPIP